MIENIAGYILAGGQNRRMDGQKKLFLVYKGETFLQRIRKAMEELPVIYLSVEEEQPYVDTGLPLIVDQYPSIGPMGGICSGLLTCPESAILVAACDMPLLNRETVELLCTAYQRERKTMIVSVNGRLHPLLGIYSKEVLSVLMKMIEEGNYKMMDFLGRIDYRELHMDGEESIVRNINTLEDYKVLNKENRC